MSYSDHTIESSDNDDEYSVVAVKSCPLKLVEPADEAEDEDEYSENEARSGAPWSQEEEAALQNAVSSYGAWVNVDWDEVANRCYGRKARACYTHANEMRRRGYPTDLKHTSDVRRLPTVNPPTHHEHPRKGIKIDYWSRQEDSDLIRSRYIEGKSWDSVSAEVGKRGGPACEQRFRRLSREGRIKKIPAGMSASCRTKTAVEPTSESSSRSASNTGNMRTVSGNIRDNPATKPSQPASPSRRGQHHTVKDRYSPFARRSGSPARVLQSTASPRRKVDNNSSPRDACVISGPHGSSRPNRLSSAGHEDAGRACTSASAHASSSTSFLTPPSLPRSHGAGFEGFGLGSVARGHFDMRAARSREIPVRQEIETLKSTQQSARSSQEASDIRALILRLTREAEAIEDAVDEANLNMLRAKQRN